MGLSSVVLPAGLGTEAMHNPGNDDNSRPQLDVKARSWLFLVAQDVRMTAPGTSRSGRLRLLLDSNVVIAVEPYAGVLERDMPVGARLLRLANEQGHLLCVAPATRDELLEGRDVARRRQRLAELEKFHILEEAPVDSDLAARAGRSQPGTNDERDLRILAALHAGAATHLVTNDARLQRRAARAGLGDTVLTLNDAVAMLAGFAPQELRPPPHVTRPATYTLNTEDPIFASLRGDYADFDEWLTKVRRESYQRSCYVVEENGQYAALALLKPEDQCSYALPAPVVKISTFKVSPEQSGLKYGELLLKAILMDMAAAEIATLYVEVLPTHSEVVDFLSEFGFVDSGDRSHRGELVLVKCLRSDESAAGMSDLEFHIRYGPPALRCRQQMFVIPIEPRWHDQLFPERARIPDSEQLSLFPADEPAAHPWGNALRKAYLCQSPTNRIRSGDVVLFYRSRDDQTISAVGIVEDVLRSSSANDLTRFVGRRTVYTPTEIDRMTRSVRGVLAIRFRQDRFMEPPLALSELQAAGVLKAWPQSVTRLRREAEAWIRDRLHE